MIVDASTANDRDKRIYLATYPAMMKCYEDFDVGFFDLIIADESHRSIYKKFRSLFQYFDALEVGLTATPVKFIERNTYQLFGCEDRDPTSHFSFEEAIGSRSRRTWCRSASARSAPSSARRLPYNADERRAARQLEDQDDEPRQQVDYDARGHRQARLQQATRRAPSGAR